jgi:hypothetical protein
MNRGRVGEKRGGKETDGCPLTICTITLLLMITLLLTIVLIFDYKIYPTLTITLL